MSCKHVDAAGKLIHPFLVLRRVIYFEGQALGKCRATIVLNAGAKTEGYDIFLYHRPPFFPSPRPLGLLRFLLFLELKLNSPLELRPPRPNQAVYREDCTQCFDSIVSHSTFNGFPMLHYIYGAS
jgi:hypothetical protein